MRLSTKCHGDGFGGGGHCKVIVPVCSINATAWALDWSDNKLLETREKESI